MNRKNKAVIWLLLAIFLIIVVTSLATYAYFTAREYFYGDFNVDVTSKGVDTLSFLGSDDVTIVADVNNFAPGVGQDITGSAEIEVKLDTTNPQSKFCYEMTMTLPDNKVFTYSDGITPELLLNISKSNDKNTYESVIKDLDITEKIGVIKIPVAMDSDKYLNEIVTTKNVTKTNYWKADITLVYFDNINQAINDQKTYSATLEAKRVDCN